ncbi:MAG: hypothetical protein H7Y59_07790 [Anaerolineales bacterium]|nr:hypothetical protein [Anaerolineales bacterium]
MKSNKLSILLAVTALIISTLACAVGEPGLSNVRTAKDQDGNETTSVFATTDTIYVVSDLSNGVVGNVVSSKWYAVDVADTEPNLLLDEVDITIDEDKSYSLYFYFPPPLDGQWPVGTYKVEVYFNGVLNSTVDFTVQ